MTDELSAILAQALTRLEKGEPVEACLSRFPTHTRQLAPLLESATWTIQALSYVEAPSEAALAAGRERFLTAAAALPTVAVAHSTQAPRRSTWLRLALRPLATLALVLLALVFIGSGAVIASAQSLPGDPLYPVKVTTDEVRLFLAPDPETRAEMQAQIDQTRREEANIVAATNRQAEVNFRGRLERINDDSWSVDGLVIALDRTSKIDGELAPGLFVAVKAVTLGDGVLHARSIQVIPPPATGATGRTRTPTPKPSPMPGMSTTPVATGTAEFTPDPPATDTAHSSSPTPPVTSPGVTPDPETTPSPEESPGPSATRRLVSGPAQHTPRPPIATRLPEIRPTRPANPKPTETEPPEETPRPRMTPHPVRTLRPEPTPKPEETAEPEPTSPPERPPKPTRQPERTPNPPHPSEVRPTPPPQRSPEPPSSPRETHEPKPPPALPTQRR